MNKSFRIWISNEDRKLLDIIKMKKGLHSDKEAIRLIFSKVIVKEQKYRYPKKITDDLIK